MISIYAGILLGRAIKGLEGKHPGIGQQADIVSDLFIKGFIKFLWITIPLAVFGSLTLALNRPGGVTVGATINMVGTLMGLTLISLYGMQAYGIDVTLGDRIVVAFQSMVYATSAAGVPSASIVLIQELLTSQGVSGDFATYVTAIIITIDTLILDRMRTMLNTQSDSMSTANGLKLYYKTPKTLVD